MKTQAFSGARGVFFSIKLKLDALCFVKMRVIVLGFQQTMTPTLSTSVEDTVYPTRGIGNVVQGKGHKRFKQPMVDITIFPIRPGLRG